MSYQLERLKDLPVLHLSFSDDVVFADIMHEMSDAVFEALERESQPIYYIVDGQNLKMTFNDILTSVQYGTKTGHSNFKHRNIKQLIFVSNSKMIASVVKGLNTVSFGNVNAIVLESLDDALSYIRMNAA